LIGAMRAGTTSLFESLVRHPEIRSPSRKEIHFFDLHFHRGANWYRAFFPLRRSTLTLDASPSYLTHPEVAQRAFELIPAARIVVLVRDPAERAWSHYRHRRGKGIETRSFPTVVDEELGAQLPPMNAVKSLLDVPIVPAGLYAVQLRSWLDLYGTEAVRVFDYDDFFSDSSHFDELQGFLGISRVQINLDLVNAAPPEEPDSSTIERLRRYYREPNQELYELLGRDFNWPG
jgi:hypothetical protein